MIEEVTSTIQSMFTRKIMYVNMQMSWSGISIAFWSGILTPIMILSLGNHPDLDYDHKASLALYGMVAFGFGEVTGATIMGIVVDKFGSKIGSIKNVILVILMTATTIASI